MLPATKNIVLALCAQHIPSYSNWCRIMLQKIKVPLMLIIHLYLFGRYKSAISPLPH